MPTNWQDVCDSAERGLIRNSEEWEIYRRTELLELFREHVYGREPSASAYRVSFEAGPEEQAMEGRAVRKKANVVISNGTASLNIRVLMFTPVSPSEPVPALLLINNRGADHMDPERVVRSPFWPAESMVSRGYAAIVFDVEDVDPDFDDGFLNGVHGLLDARDESRPPDAWGTIAAWAFGASRVMDYLETEPRIDSRRVAVVGHSRGGKTALWAGATDTRFAMVVTNNSGSTGAAIARGKTGETIAVINRNFPHWFAPNYHAYKDREHELPVDQHMLLSLIAPRTLYVSSATDDHWADPASEFMGAMLAGRAYRLYGLSGLGVDRFPEPESPIFGEGVAYHLRSGEHDMTEYDWNNFMDMADRSMPSIFTLRRMIPPTCTYTE